MRGAENGHLAVKGQFVVIDPDVVLGEGSSVWNLVYIGQGSEIGRNVTIASLVHIAAGTRVGDGTTIQASACIGHNARIGQDCFIGPGVVINADPYPPVRKVTGSAAWHSVTIEDGAIIAAGAILNAGVTVGQRAIVGMGSLVTSDVPPETVVLGSPARPIFKREEYDRRQQQWADEWRSANGAHGEG